MSDQRWPRPTVVTARRSFDLHVHDARISLFVREMPRTPGYVRAEADQHDRTVSGMPGFGCLSVFRGFSEPTQPDPRQNGPPNRATRRTTPARARSEPGPTKLLVCAAEPPSCDPPDRAAEILGGGAHTPSRAVPWCPRPEERPGDTSAPPTSPAGRHHLGNAPDRIHRPSSSSRADDPGIPPSGNPPWTHPSGRNIVRRDAPTTVLGKIIFPRPPFSTVASVVPLLRRSGAPIPAQTSGGATKMHSINRPREPPVTFLTHHTRSDRGEA